MRASAGLQGLAFVREVALMRAMATDDNSYPMRAVAAELRAIGDQGFAHLVAIAAMRSSVDCLWALI